MTAPDQTLPTFVGTPLPVVAVVGRPNVGKSTLINRIMGSREAIVHDEPGVTRDRLYLRADWNGRDFLVVDTGGIVPGSDEELLRHIEEQAQVAIQEADLILFVVDADAGVTPVDEDVAGLLRKAHKPVLLVANKADNFSVEGAAYNFYQLGLGDPVPVSALHGRGSGDLLDEVVKRLPALPAQAPDGPEAIRVAIVGRPNVGKSSLTNALLGSQRMIVSPVSGTTRDAIDTGLMLDDQPFVLVDTAGIRRKAKVDYGVEQFSVVRALKAIDRADVVALVIDAVDGVTDQDQRIAKVSDESGKPMIIVVNKWDALEKDTHTMERFREQLLTDLRFVTYAPMVFVSAKTGQRVKQVLPTCQAAASEAARRVPTGVVNQVIGEAVAMTQPPGQRGKHLRIYYVSQVQVNPPTFAFSVNDPRLATDAYRRYLEHQLRAAFGFTGTPIRLTMKGKHGK